jgi:hypothetical protein
MYINSNLQNSYGEECERIARLLAQYSNWLYRLPANIRFSSRYASHGHPAPTRLWITGFPYTLRKPKADFLVVLPSVFTFILSILH